MRPGQSCPGVGRLIDPAVVPLLGFNEAGAIMPRSGVGTPYPEPRVEGELQ